MTRKTPDHKMKKFYYRRAEWDQQGKQSLEKILISAHAKLDKVGKRTFSASSGSEIRGASFKNDKGLYLQIASYIPDDPTSIIDKSVKAKQSNVTAQDAPEGKNFLDGEVFVYIKDNHVILCPSGARETVAETYIWHILKTAGKKDIAKTFELDKVAKTDKLRMIRDEGVKGIDLNVSLYEASLIHIEKGKPKVSSWGKVIADQLLAISSKDKDLDQITEKENLNVKIVIKVDGMEARKNSKDVEFGKAGRKRLEKTAVEAIYESDEGYENGFIIETGAGNKITSDEIRVSDSLRVETLGKSLKKVAAWIKLKEYYERLNADGILKQ